MTALVDLLRKRKRNLFALSCHLLLSAMMQQEGSYQMVGQCQRHAPGLLNLQKNEIKRKFQFFINYPVLSISL
jgi:hypothetical protein